MPVEQPCRRCSELHDGPCWTARMDRWLCSAGLFVSATAARKACKAGHIRVARAVSLGCLPAAGCSPGQPPAAASAWLTNPSAAWVVSDGQQPAKPGRAVSATDAVELRTQLDDGRYHYRLIEVKWGSHNTMPQHHGMYAECDHIELPTGWSDERLQSLAAMRPQQRSAAQYAELTAWLDALDTAEATAATIDASEPEAGPEAKPECVCGSFHSERGGWIDRLDDDTIETDDCPYIIEYHERVIEWHERAAEAADRQLQAVLREQVAVQQLAAAADARAAQLALEFLPYGRRTGQAWAADGHFLGSEAAAAAATTEDVIGRKVLTKRLRTVGADSLQIQQPGWWVSLRAELREGRRAEDRQASDGMLMKEELALLQLANRAWLAMSKQERALYWNHRQRAAVVVVAAQRLALAAVCYNGGTAATIDPELVFAMAQFLPPQPSAAVFERCTEQWSGFCRPPSRRALTGTGETMAAAAVPVGMPSGTAEQLLLVRVRQCLAFSAGEALEPPLEVTPSVRYPAGLIVEGATPLLPHNAELLV